MKEVLERYEEINLVLNWEKCHFMVKSKQGQNRGNREIATPYNNSNSEKLLRACRVLPKIYKGFCLNFKALKSTARKRNAFCPRVVLGQDKDKVFHVIHYASKTLNLA
ncbi:Transposon Ty3-I Gag-Pol polyprotein [Gossypium australe]|uniref:Transposon Ty3-I Gag-Pol polyprotein n=1 Tax=Gossypium australe TaxID=47621 RepID=A0A5B6VZD5_9ROSI|nr:Transposon Ty3-I Gag-Pol polyprotein [Gossypium australe]